MSWDNLTLSIITPTLNNAHDLEYFISTIKKQNFDQNKIEILIIDGGSTDQTKEIARKHGLRVINNPFILAEPAVSIGMEQAKGDLMMVLASDNIFKDKNAIKSIVSTFENPEIFAALPKHDYDNSDNLLTKYHNTFTDPFNHFVYGYSSNLRTFNKVYKTIRHTDSYDIYDFVSSDDYPMMSFSQGFTLRKNFRRDKKDYFDDVTPVIDMIQQNKQIAYVYSISIYHHTIKNITHFIKKQRWATQNALDRKNYGIAFRLNKLSKTQRLRIFLWPIYSISIFFPLLHALIKFIKDKEPLWLLHPIECILCAYANIIQVFDNYILRLTKKSDKLNRQ